MSSVQGYRDRTGNGTDTDLLTRASESSSLTTHSGSKSSKQTVSIDQHGPRLSRLRPSPVFLRGNWRGSPSSHFTGAVQFCRRSSSCCHAEPVVCGTHQPVRSAVSASAFQYLESKWHIVRSLARLWADIVGRRCAVSKHIFWRSGASPRVVVGIGSRAIL